MRLFILLATFLGINEISNPVTASPDQSRCRIEDQQLPHETKCNLYYRCIYGRKVLKICPTRKLFNANIGNCDDNYNVNCGYLERDLQEEENIDVSEHVADDTVVTYVDPDFITTPGGCPEITDPYEEAVLLPHEKKCNAFYRCSKGRKYTMACPGVLQFNPRIRVCDWPVNVKCKETVQSPSTNSSLCLRKDCRESTMYLPHPRDMKSYIRCENGREIEERCPDGLVFDANIHTCNFPIVD